jgi:hypothetical protein
MEARLIDLRDQTSEVPDPSYRVCFWADDGAASEEWGTDLRGLVEVLDW